MVRVHTESIFQTVKLEVLKRLKLDSHFLKLIVMKLWVEQSGFVMLHIVLVALQFRLYALPLALDQCRGPVNFSQSTFPNLLDPGQLLPVEVINEVSEGFT